MRIGIITHYYNSKNYGGNLQAYALCKFLSKYAETEQICYNNQIIEKNNKAKRILKNPLILLRIFKKIFIRVLRIINKKKIKKANECINERHNAMVAFNLSIPHSKVCYNSKNIKDSEKEYDIFITGSDQVWYPKILNDAYLLNFVKGKKKISYAASLTAKELSDEEKERFKNSLKDYHAISVREKHAVELLQDVVDKKIQYVIDPVFLIDRKEWEGLASRRIIEEDYLFCYFIGKSQVSRKIAFQYAKKYNLKIVNIPYLTNVFRKSDYNFGDYSLTSVSPNDFLSLLKYASIVFTDSFHATAFSHMFDKEYFVFELEENGELSERIKDITKLLCTEERFCSKSENKESLKYILSLNSKMNQNNEKLEDFINKSKKYLKKVLD